MARGQTIGKLGLLFFVIFCPKPAYTLQNRPELELFSETGSLQTTSSSGGGTSRRRFPLWLGSEINAKPGSILNAYGQQDVTFTRFPGTPSRGGCDDPQSPQTPLGHEVTTRCLGSVLA